MIFHSVYIFIFFLFILAKALKILYTNFITFVINDEEIFKHVVTLKSKETLMVLFILDFYKRFYGRFQYRNGNVVKLNKNNIMKNLKTGIV